MTSEKTLADDIKTVRLGFRRCDSGAHESGLRCNNPKHAALARVIDAAREGALYVQQDRKIRAEHGWKRDGREMWEIVRDLIAALEKAERERDEAQRELHGWRNGRQLGTFQEDLNAERGRRIEAEARAERFKAALERISQIEDQKWGRDWQEIELAREVARAALSEEEKRG